MNKYQRLIIYQYLNTGLIFHKITKLNKSERALMCSQEAKNVLGQRNILLKFEPPLVRYDIWAFKMIFEFASELTIPVLSDSSRNTWIQTFLLMLPLDCKLPINYKLYSNNEAYLQKTTDKSFITPKKLYLENSAFTPSSNDYLIQKLMISAEYVEILNT